MQTLALPLVLLLSVTGVWIGTVAQGQEVPALPTATDGQHTQVPVGGGKVSLDHLGPAIVSEDGTLRRITNWAELTDAERAVALRRIADRNKARLELLRQLKEVQLKEREREERLQRILSATGEVETTPVASRLLGSQPLHELGEEPAQPPSARRQRKTPDERERERAIYRAAEEQAAHQAAHIVQVEVDWAAGSGRNATAHEDL